LAWYPFCAGHSFELIIADITNKCNFKANFKAFYSVFAIVQKYPIDWPNNSQIRSSTSDDIPDTMLRHDNLNTFMVECLSACIWHFNMLR